MPAQVCKTTLAQSSVRNGAHNILSRRFQRRVLERVADGRTNKEIAAELGISETGAKKHVEKLRRRYGVDNRVSLVRAAVEGGDITFPGRPGQ